MDKKKLKEIEDNLKTQFLLYRYLVKLEPNPAEVPFVATETWKHIDISTRYQFDKDGRLIEFFLNDFPAVKVGYKDDIIINLTTRLPEQKVDNIVNEFSRNELGQICETYVNLDYIIDFEYDKEGIPISYEGDDIPKVGIKLTSRGWKRVDGDLIWKNHPEIMSMELNSETGWPEEITLQTLAKATIKYEF